MKRKILSLLIAIAAITCTVFALLSVSGCTNWIALDDIYIEYDSNTDGYKVVSIKDGTTNIDIPASYNGKPITAINDYAFYYCDTLNSITIPDSVTYIGTYAFTNCTSLSSVSIPDSVTTIGEDAFRDCTSLKYYEFDNAYYLGNKSNPYILLMKAKSTSIIFCQTNGNTKFIYTNAFYGCSSLLDISISQSVTSIGSYAFYGCQHLTSIVLPDNITYIGKKAFGNCRDLNYTVYGNAKYISSTHNQYFALIEASDTKITNCDINENTKIILSNAFQSCKQLASIVIPNGITYIDSATFWSCSALTSIVIPDGVTFIGSWAFQNCSSLTSIAIPSSLTSIDFNAFDGCSALTDVYYNGSKSNWAAIKIGTYNTALTNAKIHYNN